MHDAESFLLQAYERAVASLQALDRDVGRELKSVFDPGNPGLTALRQLAFLEGLRRQRDDAWQNKQHAEAALIDHFGSKLGFPPDPAG